MSIPVHHYSGMCISSNMAASEMCIPYLPPLQTSVGFISVFFFFFFLKIMSNIIDKRATIRDKIIAKQFLAIEFAFFVGCNVDVNIRSRSSPYPT